MEGCTEEERCRKKDDAEETSLPNAADRDLQLVELARIYHLLKLSLEAVAQRDGQARQEQRWSIRDEIAYQARVEPIANRMYEMACAMVEIQAGSLAGAHAKSQVLMDWCDAKGELKDALASSICADIQMMVDSLPK